MQRHHERERPNWRELVQQCGLMWNDTERGPYWTERDSYSFTSREIDRLERATNELHARCLDAVQAVIDRDWWPRFGIAPPVADAIVRAWKDDAPSLYGRFDFALGADGEPKLLEYNADTPTALLEAAVVQWEWLQAVRPHHDQFNSIHERLIAKWQDLAGDITQPLYFTAIEDDAHEDWLTLAYLQETATQAGLATELIPLETIGSDSYRFFDLDEREIGTVFKLYPWEWLLADQFGSTVLFARTQWIEPIWKMVLSNKAILPVLWDLFPGHPNLLAASDVSLGHQSYVRKPKLSREGSNITVVHGGTTVAATAGDYGGGDYIYQALADVPVFEGARPIIGAWVVDGEAAGIGIREADGWITDNRSRFVPHFIE